jgi:ferredoxin
MRVPREEAYPDNVEGRFYTDTTCINCGLCPNMAPESFRESDDATHSFVYHQPATTEEVTRAEDAMSQCPTSSIKQESLPANQRENQPA